MSGGKAPRARGRRWQTQVRQWLETREWPLHERPAGMDGDDLAVYVNGLALSIECKDQARLDLAGWVTQAVAQAPAGSVPVVIAKRRGRADPADGYAILTAADLIRLIERTNP